MTKSKKKNTRLFHPSTFFPYICKLKEQATSCYTAYNNDKNYYYYL